jgi:hypothetical protein
MTQINGKSLNKTPQNLRHVHMLPARVLDYWCFIPDLHWREHECTSLTDINQISISENAPAWRWTRMHRQNRKKTWKNLMKKLKYKSSRYHHLNTSIQPDLNWFSFSKIYDATSNQMYLPWRSQRLWKRSLMVEAAGIQYSVNMSEAQSRRELMVISFYESSWKS